MNARRSGPSPLIYAPQLQRLTDFDHGRETNSEITDCGFIRATLTSGCEDAVGNLFDVPARGEVETTAH